MARRETSPEVSAIVDVKTFDLNYIHLNMCEPEVKLEISTGLIWETRSFTTFQAYQTLCLAFHHEDIPPVCLMLQVI